MTSLSDHLTSLNLAQYIPRFLDQGITDLQQLTSIPDIEIDNKLAAFGLLKGHAIKLKLSLDQFRNGKPAKPALVSTPQASSLQLPPKPSVPHDSPLLKEAEKITSKLKEIDSLKAVLTQSKAMILNLDIAAYRRTLDQIGALQDTLRQMGGMEVDPGQTEDAEKKPEEIICD